MDFFYLLRGAIIVVDYRLFGVMKENCRQEKSIFKQVAGYKNMHLYQKSEVLVLLTDVFCRRFLPPYGDRTVDQMTQAARSGKQNIVEGSETAMTSTETEVKLVNVGRASF